MEHLIYFDNAATTFPKPMSVNDEVARCIKRYCGNPGRSGHRLSIEAAKKIFEARSLLSAHFGRSKPENVVFTLNASYALNIAVRSLYRGGRILISNIEHNSAIRPVHQIGNYGVFGALGDDDMIMNNLSRAAGKDVKMVVVSHASNVCGLTMPVKRIEKFCRQRNIKLIVDASQSAGKYKLDFDADAICAPGHKGLYGIQGCGFIVFSDKYSGNEMKTVFTGGNGVNSSEREMPGFLPERLEAGTLPTPAIAGLCEGVKFVDSIGVDNIGKHEKKLSSLLIGELLNSRRYTVYAPEYPGGTVLFNLSGIPSQWVAEKLNDAGICVRDGLHCAPLIHKALGTGEHGALRVSFSWSNTEDEVKALLFYLGKIASERY